jgi:hypothetical protein|uniref:Uncharacterized protein n=1 Tax=Sipha flava TaxID=143950 RepID=A0A2S2QIS4_9HEMI
MSGPSGSADSYAYHESYCSTRARAPYICCRPGYRRFPPNVNRNKLFIGTLRYRTEFTTIRLRDGELDLVIIQFLRNGMKTARTFKIKRVANGVMDKKKLQVRFVCVLIVFNARKK